MWDAEHVKAEGIRVLPPVYVFVALALAWFLDQTAPLPDPSLGFRWLGVVVAALAATLMAWAVAEQMRHHTNVNPWEETRSLVTSGPYAWSRNPIYLADFVLQAGLSMALGWLWGLALLPLTWAALRFFVVAKEERFLREAFGDSYAQYQGKVRRWLGRP